MSDKLEVAELPDISKMTDEEIDDLAANLWAKLTKPSVSK